MTKKFIAVLFVWMGLSFVHPYQKKKQLQVVFCLDLSGSTNGLLQDVRDNIWYFVNSVLNESPETELKIGIVGFSRPRFGAQSDYVSILSDLTPYYDFASNVLYKLPVSVEKGDQLVGTALYTAVSELHWSEDIETKKIILLFGNGRADLGGYDYRKACELAVIKKITVYPVYLSRLNMNTKDIPSWNSIAELTGGKFATMMVTKRTPYKFISPAAEKLLQLNNDLNDTYIYYTQEGAVCHQAMIEADINATTMHEQFFYSRCQYKISNHYQNVCNQWDLVSRLKINPGILLEISFKKLPESFQKISRQALWEVLKVKAERREKIMESIESLMYDEGNNSFALLPVDSVFMNSIKKHL